MQAEVLITRSYVRGENDEEHVISYYLRREKMPDGMTFYGLRIEQMTEDTVNSRQELFEEDEEMAIEIIHKLARNFVFPDSLKELIYDYRKYKSFV